MELKRRKRKSHEFSLNFQLQHWIVVLVMLFLCPDGTLQCNCVGGKCLADGSCEHGHTCKSRYFGAFCEYYDVLDREKIQDIFLRDQDPKTCSVFYGELKISYSSMKIYMVRLIGMFDTMPRMFTYMFKDKGDEFSCDGHLVHLNNSVLDYYCEKMISSQELIIKNIVKNAICHVSATEGRNMLENATITTKMIASNATYNRNGLIDGNRNYTQGSCFLSGTLRLKELLSFTPRAPIFVNYIQVTGDTRLSNSSIVGTSVMLVDTHRKYKLTYDIKELQSKVYYGDTGVGIRNVNLMKSTRFGACEVEAFGDCANGTYGFDCKSICKPRCKNSRCTNQGFCIGCSGDLMGKKCCKNTCNPIDECDDNGLCNKGCVSKRFGMDCSQECSPHCAGHGDCEQQTGTCTSGCKPGYFNHDCQYQCSAHCAGRGDCYMNGTCVSGCKPGFSGDDCSRFPVGCNCVDFKCTSSNTCEQGYQCQSKYFGLYCEYADVEQKMASLPELRDGDLNTCATVNRELIVDYKETRVYMVRLIVQNSNMFKDIDFMFEDKGETRYCEGHLVYVSSTVLEYYCEMLNKSQKVTITGITGLKICHIYVTEGQIMNFEPYNITSAANSSDRNFYNVHGLVDGNKQHVKGSCFRTSPFSHTEHLAIFLRAPATINVVQFYGIPGQGNTFNIDASVGLFYTHSEHFEVTQVYTQSARIYTDHFGQNVDLLEIIFTHPFGLCEIELIGDCAYGTYGPRCSQVCSKRCKDSRCTNEGHCISCSEGFVGKYCCKPNCPSDSNCDENGECAGSCAKGKFGIGCTQDCSPYCANDDDCLKEDGACKFGCKPGYFGPKCLHIGLPNQMSGKETKTCHCNGGKCKTPSDNCGHFENCIAGWFGYNCAYRDLSVLGTASDELITDNDIETCLADTDNIVSISWEDKMEFSSVTLTFKDEPDLGSIMLMIRDWDAEHTFMEDDLEIQVLRNHVYQIRLRQESGMYELTISWPGTGSLCSMNVNGDRNLALEFPTSPELAQNPVAKDAVAKLTDGDIGSRQSCINATQINNVQFEFPNMVVIRKMLVYPALYNKEVVVVNVIAIPDKPISLATLREQKYATVLWRPPEKVQTIKFQTMHGFSDVCEIEIFGECATPYYGFGCKERCPLHCPGQECDYIGQCLDHGTRAAKMADRSSEESQHRLTFPYVIIVLLVKTALM